MIFYKAIKWLIRTLFREQAELILDKVKHYAVALGVALEGHLLLVFVYPQFYPVIRLVARITGFKLRGFYYE